MNGKTILHSGRDREQFVSLLYQQSFDVPLEVSYKPFQPTRSLSANALYWRWCGLLSEFFTKRDYPISKNDVHTLMKHTFLGYMPEHRIGQTRIESQLKSTRTLNTAEMCDFMMQVDAWALDRGCRLPRPDQCEYDNYLRAAV